MTEQHFTAIEICQVVELGGISPLFAEAEWLFDFAALYSLKRICRLRIELELEWPGAAVALTLLDQVERLTQENKQLRHQISRLLHQPNEAIFEE